MGVDDELAALQERVRCGEPRRRPSGEPLRARIEALTELHAAGRRRELLTRIAAERADAGPVWFAYGNGLHSGLDPDSPLYREAIADHRQNYFIALTLPLGRPVRSGRGPAALARPRSEAHAGADAGHPRRRSTRGPRQEPPRCCLPRALESRPPRDRLTSPPGR